MNRCVDCGRVVSRGRTSAKGYEVRCLVCANAHVMQTWRYKSAVAKLRAKVKELEDGK